MQTKTEGCLICGEELVYNVVKTELICELCGNTFTSNAECKNHHFVCDKCHQSDAVDLIEQYCLNSNSKNPVYVANEVMKLPKVNLHGPEHHFIVPAVLLTAYFNNIENTMKLKAKLKIAKERAKNVLGGFCGFHGACGAAIGTGIFYSVLTNCTPLSENEWKHSNFLTSKSLNNIAESGGPRCCKRDTFIAILSTADYLKEKLSVVLEITNPKCSFYKKNKECKNISCQFFPNKNKF